MATSAFVLQTGLGWIGVAYGESGVCLVRFSRQGAEEVHRDLAAELKDGFTLDKPAPVTALGHLPDRLASYFGGQRVDFDEPVDLRDLTPFQRRVLEVTRGIPYGEVRSYAWVAAQAGSPRAFRAAGQALGRNPVAILIPCHRVVTSQGSLGGFGWGVDVKRALLDLEKSKVV